MLFKIYEMEFIVVAPYQRMKQRDHGIGLKLDQDLSKKQRFNFSATLPRIVDWLTHDPTIQYKLTQ